MPWLPDELDASVAVGDVHPEGALGESDDDALAESGGQFGAEELAVPPVEELEPEPLPGEVEPDPPPPGAVEVALVDGAGCDDVVVGDGVGFGCGLC